MTTHSELRIECTVHWIVDGNESQRDLIIPDREISQVIDGLIDRLSLRQEITGPTESVASLHRERSGPPITSGTLAEGGVHDGDDIWLILTPRYLPVTVHWVCSVHNGQRELLLPAGRLISEQIPALIDELGLRELVDKPRLALPSLHASLESPAWSLDATLLSLHVRKQAHLWLKLESQRLPYVLHWQEEGNVVHKQLYLAATKAVGQHLIALNEMLPNMKSAIEGPSKSTPSLHSDPKRQALPDDKTLSEVGVEEGDKLWYVLTPTRVRIQVSYPSHEGFDTTQQFLPLHQPIGEVARDLAQQFGLSAIAGGAPVSISLHPGEQAAAWPSARTLAQQRVNEGDSVWLKVQETPSIPTSLLWSLLRSRLFVIGGSALLVVLVILAFSFFRGSHPSPSGPIAAATSSSPSPLSATASLTSVPIATPTLLPKDQIRLNYARGQEAYNSNNWPSAAEAFERIVAIDPNYLDVRNVLASTYYNWAANQLSGSSEVTTSLRLVQRTLEYSPTHALALQLQQNLSLYRDGSGFAEQQDWSKAIESFTQLHTHQPDFLHVAQRLYDVAMKQGAYLESQGDNAGARAIYGQVVNLQGVDTSAAKARYDALKPTPVPPTRTPVDTSHLAITRIEQVDDPTCISMRIRGKNATNWTLVADRLGLSATFDGVNARFCGLTAHQEFTITVLNDQGRSVRGGSSPARGGDLFEGVWKP